MAEEKVNTQTLPPLPTQDAKPLLAGVAASLEGSQGKSRKPFQNPCSHPCVKQLCKHLCCKVGLEELSEEIQDLLRRRRNRIVGIPCTHNCHNKSKCGHKCCKEGFTNDGWSPEGGEVTREDRPPSPSSSSGPTTPTTSVKNIEPVAQESKKRKLDEYEYEEYLFQQAKLERDDPEMDGTEQRKTKRRRKAESNLPCRHQCLNKRTCRHTCCKVGLDEPDTTPGVVDMSTDSTDDSEEVKPVALALQVVKAAEVLRPEWTPT